MSVCLYLSLYCNLYLSTAVLVMCPYQPTSRPGGESSVYDRLFQESKDRKKGAEQEVRGACLQLM
jgi:hypothetical protein